MSFKEFIKPAKWKIILTISIELMFLSYYYFPKNVCDCFFQPELCQADYSTFLIDKSCICHCISLSDVLIEYLNLVMIPIIIIYLIISLIFYLINKKTK